MSYCSFSFLWPSQLPTPSPIAYAPLTSCTRATTLRARGPPRAHPALSFLRPSQPSRRKRLIATSHPADPLPVLPNGFERSQVARVENVFRGGQQVALLRGLPRIAGVDGHPLEHTRVTVTVNHAACAAIPDEL